MDIDLASKGQSPVKNHMIMVGLIVLFMALYWLSDVIVDVFILQESDFFTSLLHPDEMCLAMRLLNMPIVLLFSLVVLILFIKRQKAEVALVQERDLAQKYLDVAGIMLAAFNSTGEIILINHKGCEILNVTEEEALGKNWFDNYLPKIMVDEVKEVFNQLMMGNMMLGEYYENPVLTSDGEERIIAFHNTILKDEEGNIQGVLFSGEDITDRIKAEKEIKILRGIIPICSHCKQIRDDNGFWKQVEVYVRDHSDADFTHSICPGCIEQHYPDIFEQLNKEQKTTTGNGTEQDQPSRLI
ncbi:PAS domain-containing protein [Thermodesulfobacteriota bacterium]